MPRGPISTSRRNSIPTSGSSRSKTARDAPSWTNRSFEAFLFCRLQHLGGFAGGFLSGREIGGGDAFAHFGGGGFKRFLLGGTGGVRDRAAAGLCARIHLFRIEALSGGTDQAVQRVVQMDVHAFDLGGGGSEARMRLRVHHFGCGIRESPL